MEEGQVKRRTSEPCSEISEISDIKFSDITEHLKREIDSASRRTDDRMELVLETGNAQLTGMNTTIKNMSAEGDARFTAIEARFARLEDADKRTNTKNLSVDELHQLQEDQNKTRAEAAGFHENTTEQEAKDLLANTITEAGMSLERVHIKCPAKPITQAFLQFSDSDERQIHHISESTKNGNKRTKHTDITSHGRGREIPAEKTGIHQVHTQQGNETRVNSRRRSGQNMCQWISQVQEVSRHRARSTVSSRMMRQQGQSENKTMSSLECARVSIGEERDHMEGKGGGRQRLRYIDGDVPRCMRHNDDKSKSTAAQPHISEKEKGSSNEEEEKENEEGGSKEVKRTEAKKKESKDPSSNSTGKKGKHHEKRTKKKMSLSLKTKECDVVENLVTGSKN